MGKAFDSFNRFMPPHFLSTPLTKANKWKQIIMTEHQRYPTRSAPSARRPKRPCPRITLAGKPFRHTAAAAGT